MQTSGVCVCVCDKRVGVTLERGSGVLDTNAYIL